MKSTRLRATELSSKVGKNLPSNMEERADLHFAFVRLAPPLVLFLLIGASTHSAVAQGSSDTLSLAFSDGTAVFNSEEAWSYGDDDSYEASVTEVSYVSPSLEPAEVAVYSVGPLRSRVDGAQERLDAYLYEQANRNTTTSRRDAPELAATAKGGFSYEGPRFAAEILPDGTVTFDDTAGVTVYGNPKDLGEWLRTPPPDMSEPRLVAAPNVNGNGNLPQISGQAPVAQAPMMTFSMDITDALTRARGGDPYYAERAWFIRETQAARDRLAEKYLDRTGRLAAMAVVKRAQQLWSRRQSDAHGRQSLFELWDECTEDEIGNAARRQLLRYMRDELQLSYALSELATLNQRRQSKHPFLFGSVASPI